MLSKSDYQKVFIEAFAYESQAEKEAYFLGKYNQHSKNNPLILFSKGINDAYKYIAGHYNFVYTLKVLDNESLTKQDIAIYGGQFSNQITKKIYYKDIESIKQAFDRFVEQHQTPQPAPSEPNYIKIFVGAMRYDTLALAEAYFLGKYNEHKEYNPLPLFIKGITDAYNTLVYHIKDRLNDELMKYSKLKAIKPDTTNEKPGLNKIYLSATNYNSGVSANFNIKGVESIKQAFDEFAKNQIPQPAPAQPKAQKDKTFNSKLTFTQIETLAIALNNIGLFTENIEASTLQSVFECKLKEPIQIENNRQLAYLFTALQAGGYVCNQWQSVIEQNNLFLSKNANPIKRGDLATAKSDSNVCPPLESEKIDIAINEIKKH